MPARRASSVYSAFTSWRTRGGVMPDPGRNGPPPVPPPDPGPTPDPSPSTESRAASSARAPALARSAALGFGPRLLQHAGAIAVVGRRRHDGRNDNRQRLRGQAVPVSGSGGAATGSIGSRRFAAWGSGLLILCRPSRMAFGGGAFCKRPPPPPPPPGPGVSRNTRRIGSAGGSTVVNVVATGEGAKVKTNTTAANTPACNVLDSANGSPDRCPVAPSKIEKMSRLSAMPMPLTAGDRAPPRRDETRNRCLSRAQHEREPRAHPQLVQFPVVNTCATVSGKTLAVNGLARSCLFASVSGVVTSAICCWAVLSA